jgi:glycosyltransferase involved in cell wall biosynthesis
VSRPTVSVVISTYRRPDLLTASVRSVAEQTLAPDEIIVVDDCSGDDTLDALADLRREIPALRVVEMPENRGTAMALDTALSLATGDYVAIADDDDVCAPRRLEWSVELAERTGADMIGGQVVGAMRWPLRFATSRFPTDAEGIARRVASGFDPLPHITMMLRRESIDRFGGYRDVVRAADLELMLRWAHQGAHIEVSPEVFATYRFRREFFDFDTQTRWMMLAAYAREQARTDPAGPPMPSFGEWFLRQPLGPARREARSRLFRLSVRLALGTVLRRS